MPLRTHVMMLAILYYALLAAQLLAGLVFVVVEPDSVSTIENARSVLIIAVPVVIAVTLFASNLVFRNQLKTISKEAELMSKMRQYKSASIVRFALVETGYFFSIVVYFLTKDLMFLAGAGLVILYFVVIRPSVNTIAMDMELDATERTQLGD